MQKRDFCEMVAFFNRRVSEMKIPQKNKMELLGMITAIEIEHDEEMEKAKRTAKVVEEDNIRICDNCSGLILTPFASYKYCPECGAKLDWSE